MDPHRRKAHPRPRRLRRRRRIEIEPAMIDLIDQARKLPPERGAVLVEYLTGLCDPHQVDGSNDRDV